MAVVEAFHEARNFNPAVNTSLDDWPKAWARQREDQT